jgi:transposase InsO family protein
MTGALIEDTMELLASDLREVKLRMRCLFTQERVAASASLFLDGLLSDECLNLHWFDTIAEAKQLIEAWRGEYNECRPHMALGYLSPLQYADGAITSMPRIGGIAVENQP